MAKKYFDNMPASDAKALNTSLGIAVNVKHFGAKGDGVTDDTTAIQAAIDYVGGSLFSRGTSSVLIPSGKYKITSVLSIINTICIYGEGMFNTILDSSTSNGYLFNVTADSVELSKFGMIHSINGGIRLYGSHRTELSNIFSGNGSLGTSIRNDGALLCKYTKLLITTNGKQINTVGNKPNCGLYFDSNGGTLVPNMCVISSCIIEGMTTYGVYVDNTSIVVENKGQGYIKFIGCTIEGNGAGGVGYDVYLDSVFGAEFLSCHAEGGSAIANVKLNNSAKCLFIGGIINNVIISGDSVGNLFYGAHLRNVTEDSTVLNSRYTGCSLYSLGVFKLSESSELESTSNIDNYAQDLYRTNVSERTMSATRIFTNNGNFSKWINASTPAEFSAIGGASIAQDTANERSGVSCCKITAVGTTAIQGLYFSYSDLSILAKSSWISIGFFVKRPASQNTGLKITCNIGYDITVTIPALELIDDEYVFISRSFRTENKNFTITITPSNSPQEGQYVFIDELTICEGKLPPLFSSNKVSELAIAATATEYISIKANSVAPTAGNYRKGDRVLNSAPAAGAFSGWICIANGSPGTWKGFGLIES